MGKKTSKKDVAPEETKDNPFPFLREPAEPGGVILGTEEAQAEVDMTPADVAAANDEMFATSQNLREAQGQQKDLLRDEKNAEAALKAVREGIRKNEERARKAEELAAANLAANKRIVELERERDEARAELARLTTPRPIAEAPKDGAWIGAIWEDMDAEDCQCYGPIAVVKWRGTGWEDSNGDGYAPPSHFLPLPVLP